MVLSAPPALERELLAIEEEGRKMAAGGAEYKKEDAAASREARAMGAVTR